MLRSVPLLKCVLTAGLACAQVGMHMGAVAHPALPAQTALAPAQFARGMSSIQHPGFNAAFSRLANPGLVYLGSPLWWDDDAYRGPAQPTVVVLQGAGLQAPAPRAEEPEAKPADPLMIELQGGRYVRVSEAGATITDVGPIVQRGESSSARVTSGTATPLLPTVFVYRDGRREESSDYSIISGVIYAHTDYYATGAWSKQIPLAELDIPASVEASRNRGVKLVLPSSPNEVVTRP